jgi:hypothetical protein
VYGAETRTFRKVDHKYLASFKMWYGEVSGTDFVSNKEPLHRVKEERNILRTTKRRKTNWIGHS